MVYNHPEFGDDIYENWSVWQENVAQRDESVKQLTEKYAAIYIPLWNVLMQVQKTIAVGDLMEDCVHQTVRGNYVAAQAYVTGDQLNITVKDTGYGLSPQMEQKLQSGKTEGTKQGGIGVGNVRQRLNLIYGDDARFTIGNRPEGGVMVKITIPLTYIEPDILGSDDLNWDLD